MMDDEQTAFKDEQMAKDMPQYDNNRLPLGYRVGVCVVCVVFAVSTLINVVGLPTMQQTISQYADWSTNQQYKVDRKNGQPYMGQMRQIGQTVQIVGERTNIVNQYADMKYNITNAEDVKLQNLKSIKGFELYPVPVNTSRRIAMGAPTLRHRHMRIVSITKQAQSGDCLLTNGINVISATTIRSGHDVMGLASFVRWVLLLDAYDPFADQLWHSYAKQQSLKYRQDNVTVDSQYRFITKYTHICRHIVYAHNYFIIHANQLETIIASYMDPQHTVLYSANTIVNKTSTTLLALNNTDLQTISQQYINDYLFIFDASYLKILTPLNYAYYGRYILQHMLIFPLLAIVQGSTHFKTFNQILHEFEQAVVQFKQFELVQVEKQRPDTSRISYILRNTAQDLCFVSYPDLPSQPSYNNFKQYIQSLTNITHVKNATIIVNLPYKFNQSQHLWPFYSTMIAFAKDGYDLRLRIRANLTVSSLSVYEAAYTYCPNSSMLITSRHNIFFNFNFLDELLKNIIDTHHYYYCPFRTTNGSVVKPDSIFDYRKKRFRIQAMYYRQYFMNLQIFKMDFFKMIYFWILKSDQVAFYQTQASFTLPLLQMNRLRIIILDKQLYRILHERQETKLESQQLQNLKLYYQWTPIPGNNINPFLNNSLLNVAFRRNAPYKIPKIIHQTWIGSKPINQFQMTLHNTLINMNKGFEMKLWKDQNITMQNFPLTFALIKRSLEYQKFSNRSYVAPVASLIRYETLYNYGGIYIDFKTEGKKPLDPFLKYELFFIDLDYDPMHYGNPAYAGNGIMGAIKHNYHLHLVLTELVRQQNFNYHAFDFPKIVGGYILRRSLTITELFTNVGFGFQLFSPKPGTGKANLCSYQQNKLREDQKIFQIDDYLTGKQFRIGLPCQIYKQAYLIMYKVLAGTWKTKSTQPQTVETPQTNKNT